MSHFYGVLQGTGQMQSTRCGHKNGGLRTIAACQHGAICVELTHNPGTGKDVFEVKMIPWRGQGKEVPIAIGEFPTEG